mgnify:FL=1
MDKIIKLILAILLFLCLLKMPYGYYQMVRVLSMVGFGILALSVKEDKERWIYIVLCLLFQPFIKVALGRVLWNVVDVVVAIGLLISIKSDKK